MESTLVIYLIVLLVILIAIVSGILFYRAVQKAKLKQAQFEERFSKNYDRYPYRNKLR